MANPETRPRIPRKKKNDSQDARGVSEESLGVLGAPLTPSVVPNQAPVLPVPPVNVLPVVRPTSRSSSKGNGKGNGKGGAGKTFNRNGGYSTTVARETKPKKRKKKPIGVKVSSAEWPTLGLRKKSSNPKRAARKLTARKRSY